MINTPFHSGKAVVIFSGGLDSTTLLYYLINELRFDPRHIYAINFDYGQKHVKETDYARHTMAKLGVHPIFIDLRSLALYLRSSLTSSDVRIPLIDDIKDKIKSLKSTVVPFRNGIFLSIATSIAQSLDINQVCYGAHHSDAGVYPDCRPQFVEAMMIACRLGTENHKVTINAPFVNFDKSDVVKLGTKYTDLCQETWSCYVGKDKHCGQCSSCMERQRAFLQANIADTTEYEKQFSFIGYRP